MPFCHFECRNKSNVPSIAHWIPMEKQWSMMVQACPSFKIFDDI